MKVHSPSARKTASALLLLCVGLQTLPVTVRDALAQTRDERLETFRERSLAELRTELQSLRAERGNAYNEGSAEELSALISEETSLRAALIVRAQEIERLYASVDSIAPHQLPGKMDDLALDFKTSLDLWHMAEKTEQERIQGNADPAEIASAQAEREKHLRKLIEIIERVEIQILKTDVEQHEVLVKTAADKTSPNSLIGWIYSPNSLIGWIYSADQIDELTWFSVTLIETLLSMHWLWHSTGAPGEYSLQFRIFWSFFGGAASFGMSMIPNMLIPYYSLISFPLRSLVRANIAENIPPQGVKAFLGRLEFYGVTPAIFPEELLQTAACERLLEKAPEPTQSLRERVAVRLKSLRR